MLEPQKPAPPSGVKIPTMKELLEAGAHFGHPVEKWNPKMKRYIHTKRGGFHIIDLTKTIEGLEKASAFLKQVAASGEILFVGSKRQAADIVKQEAIRSGAHFVVNRWIGGLLTNFDLIGKSFKRLDEIEKQLSEGVENRTKQEVTWLKREWSRLSRLYGGVRLMKRKPAAIVIIDTHYERAAVKEASIVGVPIVAIVDTNTDPNLAQYGVPGNDDALRSITLMMKIFSDAVIAGNKGNGIKHSLQDFAEKEVIIKKTVESVIPEGQESVAEADSATKQEKEEEKPVEKEKKVTKKKSVKKVAKKTTKAAPKKKVAKKKAPVKKKVTKKL